MRVRPDPTITEALRLLGKERFILAVHDASFPGLERQDTGRGTPYGKGGEHFARFARSLGFTGLQLGPQGQTSASNPSPYDGTIFSRNFLSLDLVSLVADGLLSRRTWETIVADNPRPGGRRAAHAYAYDAYSQALAEIHANFRADREHQDPDVLALDRELKALWHSEDWLRNDALYEALNLEHGRLPWRQWPNQGQAALDRMLCAPPPEKKAACAARRRALEKTYAETLERYALVQTLLLRQHRAFRARMQAMGLKCYGDVQVGFSLGDVWSRRSLLMRDYFLGAPPSRTNLEGQPWGYQVLDPGQYLDETGAPGPVLRFVAERMGKMLAEFDGLRLDHPHGLVCPWVYRADEDDPYYAVQHGARLFSSPDLPDHPGLARYAIVRPDQLHRERPRYADDWVRGLTPEQEAQYALVMDTLMDQVREHGRQKADILFEVLSTEPLPLARVRQRHGLGRFRVTQKADLVKPDDVYRSENAQPQDWLMVGNHDTPSIWRLARSWENSEAGRRQADYLAWRLKLDDPQQLASDGRRLAHAKAADLFLSPASNIMVFFPDLLGIEETYNAPGVANSDNWTLRVPPDFSRRYAQDRLEGRALNLEAVLALALRARHDIHRPELIARLEERAGWQVISPRKPMTGA
ncbi:4-alpha-glucanotransferase [Methylohalobius crimeensis]|uniref:4-alpha-glucanotransferase n=1 Tax=Methylohalobius crimeensis TaxID=244365 RepID=UPI0003B5752F|nr:4-alpha-glucanotransferase [Methylohalobius crimeensis]